MFFYKQNSLIKIKNINNSYKNRYKIQYSIFGLRFKFPNKRKISFYNQKKEEELLKRYQEKELQLKKLQKFRDNKQYILTIYVITYNQKGLIKKCLDSLLEQKTQYSYIIKILDDASDDGTFEICLDYAKKYPEKVELHTFCHNSHGKGLTIAYENIETKYFCRIDGDDYWCNENKLQIAIDFLEKHPEYVTYAHDTALLDLNTNISKSNIHDYEPNKNITNEISFDNFFYIHVCSRIHRNVLDFKNKYKNVRKRDRILWYLLLDAGKAFYDDRIMAVYSIGQGFHNKQHEYFKSLSRKYICYKTNILLNYKYDKFFTTQIKDSRLIRLKNIFKAKLGWFIYIWSVKNLDILSFYVKSLKQYFADVKEQKYKTERYTGNFIKEDFKEIEQARKEFI